MRDNGSGGLRTTRNRRRVRAVFCNRLEAVALIAKVVEIRVGKPIAPAVIIDFENGNEPIWMGIGQRAQQHAIHDGEDCCRRANAEGESQHGNHGECHFPGIPNRPIGRQGTLTDEK